MLMCPKGLSLAQTCVLRITRIYTSWHCFSTHSFGWCKHVLILKGWKSVFFHFYLFQWMTPPWNQFLKLRIQLSLLTTPSPPSWPIYHFVLSSLPDRYFLHPFTFIHHYGHHWFLQNTFFLFYSCPDTAMDS